MISSATAYISCGESVSQFWVAKAASSHTGSESALAIHCCTRSTWRRNCSTSASRARASAAASSPNSDVVQRVSALTKRHQRSRLSLASSGASSTRPAPASTFR